MKKILVTILLGGMIGCAFGQGTVMFNNRLSAQGVWAPIFGPDPANPALALTGQPTFGVPTGTQEYRGPLLTGSGYRASLFGAPAGNPANMQVAMLDTGVTWTTFRTGTAAGAFMGATATLYNVPWDSPAIIQVRAWDNTSGLYPTWAAAEPAWLAGLIPAGMSKTWNITVGGLNPPPVLLGMESFNIYYIPEPGAFALAGLALAGMLILRRKK